MKAAMLALLATGMALAAQAAEPAPDPTWTPAERWAWEQLRDGKIADFHAKCGSLDPKQHDLPAWRHECRRLRADFVESLLIPKAPATMPSRYRVRLVGAYVTGQLDLRGTQVGAEFWFSGGVLDGAFEFDRARFERMIYFDGSTVIGRMRGHGTEAKGIVLLRDVRIKGELALRGSRLDQNLELDGSTVEGDADLSAIRFGENVFIREGVTIEGNLSLLSSKIATDLDLRNGTFKQGVDLDASTVQGGAYLRGAKVKGLVSMVTTSILHQLEFDGAQIDGRLSLAAMALGGHLYLQAGVQLMGDLSLLSANIGGRLVMTDSRFHGRIDADEAKVAASVFLTNSWFAQPPNFTFAQVGGNFDASNATLPGMDLSGARIAQELSLGTAKKPAPIWAPDAMLTLRAASVGAFQDHLSKDRDAWPKRLDLYGFSYARLGGFEGDGHDLLTRPVAWYVDWLGRHQVFTRQPYQQLASTFKAAGDPDTSGDILYAARERERGLALKTCREELRDCPKAAGLGLLMVTTGYGLGERYFRVLYWIAGVTLLGVVVLRRSAAARGKGVAWCFGASLDHLLPIVELNKEFGSFFDDPERQRLRGWQLAYFALHSLAGYVLGSFVVAGLAGLTQAP